MVQRIPYCLLILLFFTACQNEHADSQADQLSLFQVEKISSPAGMGSEEPNLFVGADGKLYLSWILKDTSGLAILQYAVFQEGHWSEAEEIARGNDWFVNWADFPAMAVDPQGNKIASFLPKSSAGTYSYDVALKAKMQEDDSWSATQLLNEDGFDGEHGFVSLLPQPDSGFFACWLDGRQGTEKGPMSVRAAFLTGNMTKLREDALDLRVCDCCQTTAVWTASGPVVLYRDRSEEEVRDISIVRWVEGQWTPPMTVFPDNWQINGCPVNGPKADAFKNQLAVAWFAMPGDTAEVKCIFSPDGGQSFLSPILIARKTPLGRVDIAMLDEERAVVSWLDEIPDGAAIMLALVHQTKGILEMHKVADTDGNRKSGFPQMCWHDNTIFLAWTDVSAISHINMTRITIQ